MWKCTSGSHLKRGTPSAHKIDGQDPAIAPQTLRSHLSLALASRIVLPLHVRNCVGSTAGERLDVIFAVAGAGAAGSAGRRAGMLSLEFPRHLRAIGIPSPRARRRRSQPRSPRCMRPASGQRGSAQACGGRRSRPPVKMIGSAVELCRENVEFPFGRPRTDRASNIWPGSWCAATL